MNPIVEIHTDGSFIPSTRSGGWAAIIESDDTPTVTISGKIEDTTNNRMEILAVLEALKTLVWPSTVTVYSDSQYVVNSINTWMYNWKKNGWKTGGKFGPVTSVKNVDLFKQILELVGKHKVKMVWVKGHANNEKNNLMDVLSRKEAMK